MMEDTSVLSKSELLPILSAALKPEGFRKKNTYWYKDLGEYLFCVNVQGSQWNANNCYINVGMAANGLNKRPTILDWSWRHRCKGAQSEINLTLDEILLCVERYMNDYLKDKDMLAFLGRNNASAVGQQFWL